MFILYMFTVVILFSIGWFTWLYFHDRKTKEMRIKLAMDVFKVERQEAIEIIKEIDRATRR